jgi:hypothetical protein
MNFLLQNRDEQVLDNYLKLLAFTAQETKSSHALMKLKEENAELKFKLEMLQNKTSDSPVTISDSSDSVKQSQKENEKLKEQIKTLESIDAEIIFTFMPLIYENFFGVVNPQDLALMVGKSQITIMPFYTEPDIETLQYLKKKFLNLPSNFYKQVIDFANEIPHRRKLKIRKELKTILQNNVFFND